MYDEFAVENLKNNFISSRWMCLLVGCLSFVPAIVCCNKSKNVRIKTHAHNYIVEELFPRVFKIYPSIYFIKFSINLMEIKKKEKKSVVLLYTIYSIFGKRKWDIILSLIQANEGVWQIIFLVLKLLPVWCFTRFRFVAINHSLTLHSTQYNFLQDFPWIARQKKI